MAGNEVRTFCRLCMGHCGVVVTLDDAGRVAAIRGDHDDPQTLGYACFKGMQSGEAHASPARITRPLKRQPDGRVVPIPAEQALDEIAARLAAIRDAHGVEAIGGYKGGGAFFTSASSKMLNSFLEALGSPKAFSSVTIDQSSKAVAVGRLGIWPAGQHPFADSEVVMLVGANPLVSVSIGGWDTRNPQKRLKAARARGMKLVVIDPRRTETARFADLHLQPLPGEDCAILAGIIRIVLAEGWHDRDFCARFASQLDELRAAVGPFTPDAVAARAGIDAADLRRAAEIFARDARRGPVLSATGPDMSAHANLAEHLMGALNVICGRFLREGERVPNPGVIGPRWPRRAEVIPAPRWWEQGYTSRTGYGVMDGELPTGSLIDEILQPGEGQLRALIVHGGNPASAIPDQAGIVRALRSLELLVTIEPFMTATAQLSDYILPPTLQYERPDLPIFIYEALVTQEPYTRFTPAVARPPEGAEVQDDWTWFWELARRLGLTLVHHGEPLDMQQRPATEDLLAIAARFCPVPFEQIRRAERGIYLHDFPQYVEPGEPDSPHRFTLMPPDVATELEGVRAEADASGRNRAFAGFAYRLASRRLRDALNSACKDLPSVRPRAPTSPAFMNPGDMAREGIAEGQLVRVRSEAGEILVPAAADPDLRPGVVSVPHGYGLLPGDPEDPYLHGANTNRLISAAGPRESINAMPRMSGIPVDVLPAG